MTRNKVIWIFLAFGCISCQKGERANVLIPEVRYMADTMFSNRKTILNSETDSLCAITRETKFSSMVDSLLQIESRRIEELSQ